MSKRPSSLRVVSRGKAPRKFWRSLAERAEQPELEAERKYEFPAGADTLDGVSRRDFINLLGVSAAVTGGAACYRPNQKIVPYVRRPPEVTPGSPLHFATAYAIEGYGMGLVVESHSGRPTKVEGNPDHPDSLGSTTQFEQAITLGLYDDDRAQQLTQLERLSGVRHPMAWRNFNAGVARRGEELAQNGGARLRFLLEPSSSPLVASMRARIAQRYPQAKFYSYSPVSDEAEVEGARLAFGRPLEARYDLRPARVILSLDSDFCAEGPQSTRLHREFSAGRLPGEDMNRLYAAEPCPTVTGMMADHRVRVRGGDILSVAQAVVAELAKLPGMDALAPLAALPRAQAQVRVDTRWTAAVAKDLHRARGKAVVFAGRRQPAAVHALVHAMNVALGAVGPIVSFRAPVRHDPMTGVGSLEALVKEIEAGAVDTLVITARNPVYGAPGDLDVSAALRKVRETIYLARYLDETAGVVTTVVPAAHELESWGDVRAVDGTVSLVQPLIAPLWSGTTEADLLGAFVGEGDKGSHELLTAYWKKQAHDQGWANDVTFEHTWEQWLAKGVIERTDVAPESNVSLDGGLTQQLGRLLGELGGGAGLEIAFAVDPKVYDGRFANNPWLQELPHPVTKMTWDNAVLMSQHTAQSLGFVTGEMVRVEANGHSIMGPVFVQPGHADDSITLSLGYGRKGSERLAAGIGFNANVLRTRKNPWFVRTSETPARAGGRDHRFGVTQDHWSMEGREPAMVTTRKELDDKKSEFHVRAEGRRGALPVSVGQEPVDYDKQPYKWAMAIDLSKCSGCSACVVACAAENNTPVVGRDNVRVGREMFWIRVDRYYYEPHAEGEQGHGDGLDEDRVEAVTQPQMCVHCETAPCEYVCPVNATVHSDEGLNEMVYNRCIGTRYCSNNCPYKARRFNFLDYRGDVSAVRKMSANPNVTVRSRGIMEKCTYCVQRIERKRIDTRIEGRAIKDGEIQTACQQVCPADAIVFGSLNDPGSRVSKLHGDERRYDLLHELGTRPRTAYLARVRNPNPELA